MHVPQFEKTGEGKGLQNCRPTSYEQVNDNFLIAKERNSGYIMDRTGQTIQVTFVGSRWILLRSRETQVKRANRRAQETQQLKRTLEAVGLD